MIAESEKRYQKKIKAAHLIYKENLALQEVAKMLNISRPTLSKMNEEMLQEGIVTIQIKDPRNYRQLIELGFSVRKRYGLRDVIVVDASEPDSEEITERIGEAGADYFQDILRSGQKVGITGGRTIDALISNLSGNAQITDLQVITTTGGSLYANTKYHSNTLAQRFAEAYHGTGHFIYAPTYTDNKEQHDMLLENSHIMHTLALCKSVDIALVGVGNKQSALGYLPRHISDQIKKNPLEKLAGAINTLLLDIEGNPFLCSATDLFIGLSYEDLRRVKAVICLAGGAHKHTAIKAAVLGKYPSVLVTDRFTAEFLLQ